MPTIGLLQLLIPKKHLKRTPSSRRKNRNVYWSFFTTLTPPLTIEGSSYYYGILSTMCKSRLHSYNRTDFVSGHVMFIHFVQWSCQVPLTLSSQHKIQLHSSRQHEQNKILDTNSQRKSNKMQQCIKILFHIYMKLNLFRATHRPTSGA
jgi:hypothetical protein